MATATVNQTPAPQAQESAVFTQSFSFKIPKNMTGIQEIFANPDGTVNEKALVYVVRAGLKQVINNRVRQEFTAKDDKGNPAFAPQEGIYDATKLVLNAPQRAVLSQRDKLEKNLKSSNLPQAVIDTMLATYDSNVGTAPEEGGNTAIDTNEARVVLGGKEGKQLIMKVGASSDEDEEDAA
jgi:hypothetical protein